MAARSIEVRREPGSEPARFQVVVRDRDGESHHGVTMISSVRISAGHPSEAVVEAAFRFLLDREPKESILAAFDIAVISRYFPEFERELPRYLAAGGGAT